MQMDFLHSAFKSYSQLIECDLNSDPIKLSLPLLSSKHLILLTKIVHDIFEKEPVVLNESGDFIVVGDIHGQLIDLISIFQKYGIPAKRRYLFLGDIVDRGPHSLACITLLFLFKALWPKNCLIIRGNHEFHFCTHQGGFEKELIANYNNHQSIYLSFLDAFSQMPLAAKINNNIIALHGGIGPTLTNLDLLNNLTRPIDDFGNPLVDSILWSDPDSQISKYEPSRRGTGFCFGQDVFEQFIKQSNCSVLIRGHECVMGGIEPRFDNQLYTIFSASNYCNQSGNQGGLLLVNHLCDITQDVYDYNPNTVEVQILKEPEQIISTTLTPQEKALERRIGLSKQPRKSIVTL